MEQRSHLQTSTDLNALSGVLIWFEQLEHSQINPQFWLECQLALAEGFTNAVRHAHGQRSVETPIDLEAILTSDWLELRIWDCGHPFDLHLKLAALPEKIDAEQEGGRGLKLLQTIADDLHYIRTADQRNCLVIRKQLLKD